jgi:hypothetical protein
VARTPTKPTDAPPVEHQEAAVQRAAEATRPTIDPMTRSLLDALANERRGYVARGLDDRAAQVDAQINRLGG